MVKYLFILLFLSNTLPYFSQKYSPIVPPDYIKTVQLFNPVTQNQSPFISFDEYFIFSFDDLNSTYQKYYYYIKHYDRNWNISDLFESEYCNGFFTDEITNYTSSYNTLQNYIHYELRFPNTHMQPKISGNYALFVYTENKKKPLFSIRFSIFENQTTLGISQNIFNAGEYDKANQKIEVIATSNGQINLNQNLNNTSLTILKNNNWNESLSQIKPQFVFNNRLEFKQYNLLFYGGNEFYWFNTKNIEVYGLTTEKIMENDLYETVLYANQIHPSIYDYNPDINGAFYIRRNDLGTERNANHQADYTRVNFALSTKELPETEIYVVGTFNNYNLSNNNKLLYNKELNLYEVTILLKQGYYNYQFVAKDAQNNLVFTLNGNFWETENLYTALLYYSDFSQNYDRLIGIGEN